MDETADVIVKWQDDTKNCVSIKELKCVNIGENINCIGTKVKMYYRRRWYFGTVVLTEVDSQQASSQPLPVSAEYSSDDEPLSKLTKRLHATKSDDEDPFQNYDVEEPNDPDFVWPPIRPRQSSLSSDVTICIEDEINSVNKNENFTTTSTIQLLHPQPDGLISGESCQKQTCEVIGCNEEVFSACVKCLILQCWEHFLNDVSCDHHFRLEVHSPNLLVDKDCAESFQILVQDAVEDNDAPKEIAFAESTQIQVPDEFEVISAPQEIPCAESSQIIVAVASEVFYGAPEHVDCVVPSQILVPEAFEVDGAPREAEVTKKANKNKRKQNKLLKDLGKKYITQVKKAIMPERKVGPACNKEYCQKQNRKCLKFDEDSRKKIFDDYWAQGDLQRQREFIARHVVTTTTQRKTAGPNSRRQLTFQYYMTFDGERVQVCRYLFLNTLNISERTLRTAVKKVSASGIVEKDKRGGRVEKLKETDEKTRELVEKHIDRFPRVESHYCRESSTREYLHSDLTIKKMYDMFVDSLENSTLQPSFSTYRRVFRSKNLSFHHPKKDQCSLCMTYREGNEEVKSKLQEKYDNHIEEKKLFREKRADCKQESKRIPNTVQCATFDLQQVISLPISKENAVFYKRRLSAYNLTMYDMTTGDCYCFTWHEGLSKRGASEVSTALNIFLKKSDERGLKCIYLFADGCSGQNRNSIVASSLLYTINNTLNLEEITLQFSVPNHGQSEGDSAHSAISYALKKTGDVFVPAQLVPVFKLARRSQPYHVISLDHKEFLNFKKLSADLRLLSLRKDDAGTLVNWTEMTEFSVRKAEPTTLFFKTTHKDVFYRSLRLKKQKLSFLHAEVSRLNVTQPKISNEKYQDLISLTTGDVPVIRLSEHVDFYKSLPH